MEEYGQIKWKGVLEKASTKVSAKVSEWNLLSPKLNYRSRVLVTNNLAASILWLSCEPPSQLVLVGTALDHCTGATSACLGRWT